MFWGIIREWSTRSVIHSEAHGAWADRKRARHLDSGIFECPEYPTIPPGPIVLVVAAAVIGLGTTRWRWLSLGALLSLQITIGAFVTPYTANRLENPAAIGVFIGTLIQLAVARILVSAGQFSNGSRQTCGGRY
jgi:hypothetical protein